MDTKTGEIKHFNEGESIPAGWVQLQNLPNINCPDCRGKGKFLRK